MVEELFSTKYEQAKNDVIQGQTSCSLPLNDITWEYASSTNVPHDQKSKQSWVTNLSLSTNIGYLSILRVNRVGWQKQNLPTKGDTTSFSTLVPIWQCY